MRVTRAFLIATGMAALASCASGTEERAQRGPTPVEKRTAVIEGGQLLVDETPVYLWGGDLHYFRVRAEDFDAERTHAMWAESLDLMKAMGMNSVSTYLAWDYHQLGPDEWDFSGARDVGAFFHMVCERDMHLVIKPGPLITGEWPRGFGTFGAVPAWWKEAHPEALVRQPDGTPWNYGALAADQVQPTYLHPAFLEAVNEWYRRVLEIARPYRDWCIVGVQIDNETNFYWGDRYTLDYSETALDHYRAWLAGQYGSIAALNDRYGRSYGDFAQVQPPTAPPTPDDARADNNWHADWYHAANAYIGDYLAALKEMIRETGFDEPEVFFLTNDSPFTLPFLYDELTLRDVILHDGPTKNAAGLGALDLYPKLLPQRSQLQDYPFQADYFTRLYDHYGDLAYGPQEYTIATELQGGFYTFPAAGPPDVRPEATSQILARTIGRGLKAAFVYVIRDGINLDGSPYDYQAAIARDGSTRPRFDVLARWGAMLQSFGTDLLQAREVTSPIAILTHGAHQAPHGGVPDAMQRLFTFETPGIFGWLVAAGFNPVVLDAELVSAADLHRYRAVVFQNPDFVDAHVSDMLVEYVEQGGTLINFLWPGRSSGSFTGHASGLAGLFPARHEGQWDWFASGRRGEIRAEIDGESLTLPSYWYMSLWSLPAGTGATPLAWEQTVWGDDGDVVGYQRPVGEGQVLFLGTNIYRDFGSGDYYTSSTAALDTLVRFARLLLRTAGIEPAIVTGDPRHLAWARTSPDRTYLFVINDTAEAAVVDLRVSDGHDFGLRDAVRYRVTDAVRGLALTEGTGAVLRERGVAVPLAAHDATMLVVEPF